MGIMNKLKSFKNALTGGAAKVEMTCEVFSLHEPFTISIQVTTGDAPVKINNVYLNVSGKEEILISDYDVEYDRDGEKHTTRETIHRSAETVSMKIKVDQEQELEANETYNWEVEVTLPEHALPVYYGEHCRHTYSAQAGLDCFGNDPDSGWLTLHE